MFAASPQPASTTPPPAPTRARIFSAKHESMWSWRHKVRNAMIGFAVKDLPAGKRRRDWKAKAHAFASCGRTVSALACNNCNEINYTSGTIIATCGLRICPICARRRAEKLRHRLRAAWDKQPRHRRHGLYFLTFTMRYDPSNPDEVTADALLRRKNEMLEAWSSVWRQYLKPRGRAACRAIEVGASGMVHVHVLYDGRRPDIEAVRARWVEKTASPIVNVRHCKQPDKAIVELAKYLTKGASPAKASIVSGTPGVFMDPELAVRVEIAFSGDRMVQCYGKWLGISVDDDDDDVYEDERSAGALHAAPCRHCGLCASWHAANYPLDEWFARFGDYLQDWKPRIGGAGPQKPETGDDDDAERSRRERIDYDSRLGEHEQARRLLGLGNNDRSVPGWARRGAALGA